MPEDETGKYFMSEEKVPHRYYYEIDSWVKEREYPKRRTKITDEDLPSVDFMAVKIRKEDDDKISYETVWGPMEDYEFIEAILSYDFGDEGSRNPTAA